MKNGQQKSEAEAKPDTQETPILVGDVAQYLSGLAKLHRQNKTGNIGLSNGLQELSNALRPYAEYPVAELSNAIKIQNASPSVPKTASRKATAHRVRMALPTNLESVSQSDIEEILDNDHYTKQQIAELGFRRFGISNPMHPRLPKEAARRSVRSAMDNERTLDVISKMARKAGKARAS